MHEERFGDDPACTMPADRGSREIPVHMVYQEVALRLLEFIEHHDALFLRCGILQEVKEPLEQVGIVFPQSVPGRGMGVVFDDAGKSATAKLLVSCSKTEATYSSFARARAFSILGSAREPSSSAARASVGTHAGSTSTSPRSKWRTTLRFSSSLPLSSRWPSLYRRPKKRSSASSRRSMSSYTTRSWMATPARTS